jgi:hypothetical protein
MTTYTLIKPGRSVVHCRDIIEFRQARMDAHREFIKAQHHKQMADAAHEQHKTER